MHPVGDLTTDEVVAGQLVIRVDPSYPKEAKKHKIEGPVELIATIDKSGNVSGIAISRGDLTLAEAAVDAVRDWKFEPYTENGRPVEAWQKLRFNFAPGSKKLNLTASFPRRKSQTDCL